MANASTKANAEKPNAPSYEDITEQLETLRGDIAALTRTVADIGLAKKDELTGAATESAAKMRAKGRETMDHAQSSARDAAEATSQKIQDNPAAAVGIATGIGFLLGVIFARK